MLACPFCNLPLSTDTIAGTVVTGCHTCGGIWFEADDLTFLVREHWSLLPEIDLHFTTQWSSKAERRSPPLCARCGGAMLPQEFQSAPGLPMSGCPACKTLWLSKGQLAKLQRAVGYRAPSAKAPPLSPPPTAPVKSDLEQPSLKEKLFELPVWAMCSCVATFGVLTGLVAAMRSGGQDTQGIAGITALGPMANISFFAVITVFRWLFQTFLLWLGLWIMGIIVGERFQVGFMEGYRSFLPASLVMQAVGSVAVILVLLTQIPAFLFLVGIANLLVLRYFLDMEGFEVIVLWGVLSFMSFATKGLL